MHLKVKYSTLASVMYLCLIPLVYVTGIFLPSGVSRRAVIGTLLWIIMLIGAAKKKSSEILDSLVLLSVILAIFGISYALHPVYREFYRERFFSRIFSGVSGVSGYLVIRQNTDKKSLANVLKISGYVLFTYYFIRSFDVIIHGYWTVFSVGNATNAFSNSSMEFGYSMLFPALIFLAFYILEKKPHYLVMSLIGIAEIVLYGGRGPVFAYACFAVLVVIFVWLRDKEVRYKGLKILCIVLLLGVVLVAYTTILNGIVSFLSSMGIQSRVLTYVINGEATADNGRNWIQLRALEMIRHNSPFIGYGPLADNYYIGYYTHNILLELMVDFGAIPGLVLFLSIVIGMLKTILKCKDLEYLVFLFIFVCCGFVKLLYSNTLWSETYFWMMLAMPVNCRKEQYGSNKKRNLYF